MPFPNLKCFSFWIVLLIPSVFGAEALPTSDTILRILVADDAPSNRKLLVSQLKKDFKKQTKGSFLTMEILEAENGDQVIESIRKQAVHAIILDGVMPVRSGPDVLMEIADEYPGYIVAWSGSIDHQDEMLALGAHSPLPKPYDVADVGDILKEILKHVESED